MERRTVLKGIGALSLPIKLTSIGGSTITLPSGRNYVLHNPSILPQALVIGLPGTGLTADNLNTVFWNGPIGGWQTHATQKGYTLALGNTLSGDWNLGPQWTTGTQDDIAYIMDVVTHAKSVSNVDRVFIAGFSAGAAMAWKATALRPDIFEACGSASGWAVIYPSVPIDCMHFHGTADTTVPIKGGTGFKAPYVYPPAMDESLRTKRGSRVALYALPNGHAAPGWAADRLWQFWTVERMRP